MKSSRNDSSPLLGIAVKKSNSKSSSAKNLAKTYRRRQRNRAMRMESLENREMLNADYGAIDFPVDLSADHVPHEIVVQYEQGTPLAWMYLMGARNGAELVNAFTRFGSAHYRLHTAEGASADPNVSESGSGSSSGDNLAPVVTHDIINQWEALDGVAIVEPNYRREITQVFTDDEFAGLQWGVHNTGGIQPQGVGVPDADIDAPEAWEITQGQTVLPAGTGNEVVIAVLDTGTDFFNADWNANVWINKGEIPDDLIDNDGNGYIDDVFGWDTADGDADPTDTDGHGTHVAGTVGADGDNTLLVTGIAPHTKIMTLRAGNPGFSIASLLESYQYVSMMKSRGENIVATNNSYGGDTASAIEQIAIQQTIDDGILFIAASGNDGRNVDVTPHYPSGYVLDGIISVGASDFADQLAVFSNNGRVSVDLHAPGVDILSTVPVADGVIDYFDGTSMATPHVSGVVALLADLNPGATPLELKQYILDGVDQKTQLNGQSVTGGRLNAMGAINAMPNGTISGVVFNDANNNGTQDIGELGIGGVTILLDRNFDGVEQEVGEVSVVTSSDGSYSITNYWHTDFQLVIVIPAPAPGTPPLPFQPPAPIVVPDPGRGNDLPIDIPIGRGQVGGISGIVFNDLDADGLHDGATATEQAEPGLGGVYVFLDLNGDDRLQFDEPTIITSADGSFDFAKHFSLNPNTYTTRIIVPPGWSMTTPVSNEKIFTTGLSTAPITGLDFGLTGGDSYDFGDLGSKTTMADGGAHAGVLTGFHLGADISREADAVATDSFDDGITVTSNVFAGGTVTTDVAVSLGGFRPGFLQAWVDANNDGLFGDDEQVISNVRLLEGTHEVSFTMPANAATGAVPARFRYGWEFGIGPYDAAMAGEIEDYVLNIAGDNPVANPDVFVVNENTADNSLDVLANDFASSFGGLFVQGLDTSATSGTVSIASDGQSVLYTPRASFSGTDTFTYIVEDNSGEQASATVSVNVLPTFANPVAIDDSAVVPENSSAEPIFVLLNDLPGNNGPLTIISTSLPANGTVTFDSSVVYYTPNPNFEGLETFTYTVVDQANVSSSATVSVFVGDSTSDDTVQYFVEFTAMDGVTPLVNNEITLGGEFLANVYVQDIRPVDAQLPEADHGVFAAYLDLLYPAGAISLNGNLSFTGDFPTVLPDSNFILTPGILDESGAVQDINAVPPGSGKQLVYRAAFTANALGLVTLVPNPADEVFDPGPPQVSGDHDTLFWEPVGPALPDQISYLPATITVVASGEPAHNLRLAADVDGDGRVGNTDLAAAATGLGAKLRGEGNGETIVQFRSTAEARYFDVTADKVFNFRDVLAVLNAVKDVHSGNSEPGEILSVRPTSEAIDFSGLQQDSLTPGNAPQSEGGRAAEDRSDATFYGTVTEDDAALQQYLDDESSDLEGDDDFFADILASWE